MQHRLGKLTLEFRLVCVKFNWRSFLKDGTIQDARNRHGSGMARARIKVGDGVRWCVRCGAVYDCGVKPKGRSRSSEKKINKKKL